MRLAVPDLVSNSYFPAIAAVELGLMRDEGLDVTLELRFPVTDAARSLRDGEIELLAGAAHAPLYAFPDWSGVRLLAALARNMYWFLVVRADRPVRRGDLAGLAGLRIGAAPGPDLGLRALFAEAGLSVADLGISIAPVPAARDGGVSFGVSAAQALAEGGVDGFWANGMGAEVAVRSGHGRVVLDARRDGGAPAGFTFPALMATSALVEHDPDAAAAAVRAVRRAHQVLRDDPAAATAVGRRLFPAMEAELIAELVRRDLAYYDATISPADFACLSDFAERSGLQHRRPDYADVVATRFAPLWSD